MKKLLPAILLLVGCGLGGPKLDDITCQSGHGTCYVVHCEGRPTQECESHFKKFCPKGFEDRHYGNGTPGHQDRLLECK